MLINTYKLYPLRILKYQLLLVNGSLVYIF